MISTLDRTRIKSSDCMYLSRRRVLTVRFKDAPHGNGAYLSPTYTYPNSPAFLYYHLPPGLPEIAGELRLRLTSGSDPSSFDAGVDLISHEGIWRLPLTSLANRAPFAGIRMQLLRDGLVTTDLLSTCERLWAELKTPRIENRSNMLHSIEQEFFICFTATAFTVTPVNRGTVGQRCRINDFTYNGVIKFFAQGTSRQRLIQLYI
jgi:hypothetical protein